MAKSKDKKKNPVKVRDLKAKKNPKGGADAQQQYYTIKMNDVLVSSYNTSTQPTTAPTDSSLNFTKIK